MFSIGRLTFLTCGILLLATVRTMAADTLKIGIVGSLTGAMIEQGYLTVNGAHLAVDEINQAGGVLGGKLELVIEDDQTTNPGSILAFNKLADNPEIRAFLGPPRSTAVHAIAPDVTRVGKPMM